MGIPKYYSLLVQQHRTILRELNQLSTVVHNFYLDSNSIVHNAANAAITKTATVDDAAAAATRTRETVETDIIHATLHTIQRELDVVQPTKSVLIAFDGVAPRAKQMQQYTRRLKSMNQSVTGLASLFDKSAITPGTPFMKKLDDALRATAFVCGTATVRISGSDEPGEGEHKIFTDIRRRGQTTDTTVIYGLDSDLIMLSLNHMRLCPQLYLYRETPEFVKSIDATLEPNHAYLLDIPLLAERINVLMGANVTESTDPGMKERWRDYAFLCFLLGNDFLPHFPAINIRSNGLDLLLQTYQATVSPSRPLVTDTTTIHWGRVRKVLQALAAQEHALFMEEHKQRDHLERRAIRQPHEADEGHEHEPNPLFQRGVEKFINPFRSHWQQRYYKSLFGMDNVSAERKQQICINYLEGLEWTLRYYSDDCPDWRWMYLYNYPPLLQDLLQYIPHSNSDVRSLLPPPSPHTSGPVTIDEQLRSVLPACYHEAWLPVSSLQPQHASIRRAQAERESRVRYQWAYCRYFWEAKPVRYF